MRALGRAVLALTIAAAPLEAQVAIRGRVVAAENDQPLAGARVLALARRMSAETDRYGRFVLWGGALPDTLVARFIGRAPDTLVVDESAVARELTFRLRASPVPIAGIVVPGDSGGREVDVFPSRWSLPREAMAAVPSAVEADVLRSLALSPAVAYSTPLSAQPFVRGADPGAVGYRLDGFTLINPFHLGRIFGAVMPQAVQSAAVAAAPFAEEWGDATSAVVDVQVRDGGAQLRGGSQASLINAAAWLGGPTGAHRWFLAWRHGFVQHLPGPFQKAPYALNDLYGRFLVRAGDRTLAQVTAFWSGDRIFNRETGDGVEWGNGLLGIRAPFTVGRSLLLEGWLETSRFYENVVNVPLRGETGVKNRLATSAAGVRATWIRPTLTLSGGVELRTRSLSNRIEGGGYAAPSSTASGLVGAAFGGLDYRVGRVSAHVGARLDRDRVVSAFQPRARLGMRLADEWTLSAAAGRAAKLYHVLPDVQPDVDIAVYDLWRAAGRDGAPVPIADHAVLELKHSAPGRVGLRTAAFYSRLRGVGEIRPLAYDTAVATFFRFGRGRVYGLETELSTGGPRHSLGLAYVLSWSRRTWDSGVGEIPWQHDRRHQARVFFAWTSGKGWHLTWLGELASPEPMTPALGAFSIGRVIPGIGAWRDPGFFDLPTIALGRENAARGAWVGHIDLGVQKEIGGPGRSRGRLGVSILNLSFTRVAPVVPRIEFDEDLDVSRLIYKPRFILPPIPTFTINFEF